jgi:hypothetical protein
MSQAQARSQAKAKVQGKELTGKTLTGRPDERPLCVLYAGLLRKIEPEIYAT